jgi:hypothetical protein
LTGGVQAGLLSREKKEPRGADRMVCLEGNIVASVRRELDMDPARSENHGMYASSMRENRESPSSPVARSATGRPEGG